MICRQCGIDKPAGNFYWLSTGRIARGQRCRQCWKETRDRGKHREYQLRYTYGIEPAEYDRLFKLQDGKCAICGKSEVKLCVDHDHKTDKVRGLLCDPCNRSIVIFDEDLERIYKVLDYLNLHKVPTGY